jgi:hypothetical protein
MAGLPLGIRVIFLAGATFAGVAIIGLALTFLFVLGLASIPPAALAVGILITIALIAGIAVTIVLAASALAMVLVAVVLFIVVALVASPPVAVIAVIFFALLLAMTLILLGNPVTIGFGALVVLFALFSFGILVAGLLGPGSALVFIAFVGYAVLALFVVWLFALEHRLPIEWIGLGGLSSMPVVPLPNLYDFIDAIIKLRQKEAQRQAPIDAMTNEYTLAANTIRARKRTARQFLFDESDSKRYSLDKPGQFDMGWTTFEQVHARALPLSEQFQKALTDADSGSKMFWKNISRYWNPFGVLPMQQVSAVAADRFRALLGSNWDAALMDPAVGSTLFVVDMTIFEGVDPPIPSIPRFTPSVLAFFLLDTSNPGDPTFTPVLIRVSDGRDARIYQRFPAGSNPARQDSEPTAWLYALQALKTATTVWGIWLGHVYRYHLMSVPFNFTQHRSMNPLHPVRRVLGFQGKYTIAFDAVLLLVWSFPPPTSCGESIEFLQLVDAFAGVAGGRSFFADDPEPALAALGIPKAAFSTAVIREQDICIPEWIALLREQDATPGANPIISALSGRFAQTRLRMASYAGGEDPVFRRLLALELNAIINTPAMAATLAPLLAAAGVAQHPDTVAEGGAGALFGPAARARMMLQDAFPAALAIMQWNLYPIANYVVSLHRAAARYIGAVIPLLYPGGTLDPAIDRWVAAASRIGNVQGLPATPGVTVAQLTALLTSLIYRVAAHGLARLAPVGNPGLSWVGNFPPCLELSRLPDPQVPSGDPNAPALTTEQLLAFMPRTGSMGEMISFIFSFGFTDNFEELIPMPSANTTGLPDTDLHPFIGLPAGVDAALQQFRREITGFIWFFEADANALNSPAVMNFSASAAQLHQWERNIEQ